MWRRTVLTAEGLGEALRRGILNAIDVSIWNIVKLFLWILLIYSTFAAILSFLSRVVRPF
ncbi:MAG TPA: hypothetical protein VGS09_04315 [Actinomycetota bacterium]|jgi:hypothetical protein|nr:hypothetical protein [Actinomycetota bacterium]